MPGPNRPPRILACALPRTDAARTTGWVTTARARAADGDAASEELLLDPLSARFGGRRMNKKKVISVENVDMRQLSTRTKQERGGHGELQQSIVWGIFNTQMKWEADAMVENAWQQTEEKKIKFGEGTKESCRKEEKWRKKEKEKKTTTKKQTKASKQAKARTESD